MGKLYDRVDLEWELNCIDTLEQETNSAIANGTLDAMAMAQINISTEWRLGRYGRERQQRTIFDAERQRAKMRLLRTGQLISDFGWAKRLTGACGSCLKDAKGKVKACAVHRPIWRKATQAIKYAAEENEARRIALKQPERHGEENHESNCNQWETAYFADRRIGAWPGQSREELAYNKENFESLDYRGWLNMMRYSAEEISEADFRSELRRLGGVWT